MLRNYYYVNYYYIVLQYLRLSDHTGERRAPFNVTPHHKLLDDFLTIRPYFSFLDRLGLNKVFKCPSKLNLKYHGLPRRVFLAMPFTHPRRGKLGDDPRSKAVHASSSENLPTFQKTTFSENLETHLHDRVYLGQENSASKPRK